MTLFLFISKLEREVSRITVTNTVSNVITFLCQKLLSYEIIFRQL